MNPNLRLLTQDGIATKGFLGLIRQAEPLQPFNIRMKVTEELFASRLFKAWFDASFPTVSALSLTDDIVDEAGYPTRYLLDRWAELP